MSREVLALGVIVPLPLYEVNEVMLVVQADPLLVSGVLGPTLCPV
jgi:hypothetical protein